MSSLRTGETQYLVLDRMKGKYSVKGHAHVHLSYREALGLPKQHHPAGTNVMLKMITVLCMCTELFSKV